MSDDRRYTCALCTRTDMHEHGGLRFMGYMGPEQPDPPPSVPAGGDVLEETPENVERVAKLMTIGTLGLPFRIDEHNAPNVAKRILAALRAARSTHTPNPSNSSKSSPSVGMEGLTREMVEKVVQLVKPVSAVWTDAGPIMARIGYPHCGLDAIAYLLAWQRVGAHPETQGSGNGERTWQEERAATVKWLGGPVGATAMANLAMRIERGEHIADLSRERGDHLTAVSKERGRP